MLVFQFPQFENESFWSYLSRLDEYRAQMNQSLEKLKICEVIIVNATSSIYVESICPRGLQGLLCTTQDDVWEFFEILAWYS